MDFLLDWLIGLGILAVAAAVFAESGLLIGFFLPGDSLLFTAGLLAHQGVLNVSINFLALLLFLAAAAGDSVGYTFGRRVGHRLFRRKDSVLFHVDNLKRAEGFYKKYGAKTIVLARFIPIVRTFAPIVAGIGKMRYRQFLTYNLIGALLWAAGLTYLGYFAGEWFEKRGLDVDTYLLPIIIVIVLLSLAAPAWHILKEPAGRAQIKKSLKNFKSILLGKQRL